LYQGVERRRLTAEELRDSILFTSGELDLAPGTTHAFPAAFTWGYTQHSPFNAVYEHNRRSVYLMQQRIKRHPFLALFDGAWRKTLSRTASELEQSEGLEFLQEFEAGLGSKGGNTRVKAVSALARTLIGSNEFVHID
jgi:hypothetical protein